MVVKGKGEGAGAGHPLENDQEDRNGESEEDNGVGERHFGMDD